MLEKRMINLLGKSTSYPLSEMNQGPLKNWTVKLKTKNDYQENLIAQLTRQNYNCSPRTATVIGGPALLYLQKIEPAYRVVSAEIDVSEINNVRMELQLKQVNETALTPKENRLLEIIEDFFKKNIDPTEEPNKELSVIGKMSRTAGMLMDNILNNA